MRKIIIKKGMKIFRRTSGADARRPAVSEAVMRDEMEREITAEKEFNREIIDSSPGGIAIWDENLEIIDCNDSIINKFGGITKQYYIDNFYSLSPEYQPDGMKSTVKGEAIIRRALNGEKLVLEWMHCSVSGELIPCDVTLTRVKYNGRYVVLVYIYEMSGIKKMENSLREAGEKLRSRLEQQEFISEISKRLVSSGDSKIILDETLDKIGRYHGVSLALIFGADYERRDAYLAHSWTADGVKLTMAEVPLFELITGSFPEEMPEGVSAPVFSCPDVENEPSGDFRMLLKVNVRAFMCAPLYVKGRLWGMMSLEQSFKPREWTETEKEGISMTASIISAAIMRDINDRERSDALEQAIAASRAKSEFLSNMSHEMRTPMNAIIGMTAIGRNAVDIERKDYALSKIEDASTHLLRVINDVLDMSKIEANKMELSPVEFNFQSMLQKVVTVINFKIDERQQKFFVNLDAKVPVFIVGDDQRLAQVITNLLANAVKFTPEGGEIRLGAFLADERNGLCELRIEIADNGIGISEEQQKKLFNAFGQAESGTSRKFGGTGLGLAISKRIVELMGGNIWIESELGKGAKFIFTIKARRGEKNLRSLCAPGINWDNMRVLIVDDDEESLDYFKNLFDSLGVHCDTADDGFEACGMIEKSGGYDIYFIDWHMPGMDGIELTKRIKSAAGGRPSVATMISSADLTLVQDKAHEAGVDKYLLKPLLSSSVIDCVNECLGINAFGGEDPKDFEDGEFAGRRILIAEDVELNREIIIMLLENTGLLIDAAENGKIAVEMVGASQGEYDLVLMDVQMPEMDGLEATKRIRGLNLQPHIEKLPIIALTANAFKEDIDACLKAGMDDHIGKPIDVDELFIKLRKYLKRV